MVENLFLLDGGHIKMGGILPPKNIDFSCYLPFPFCQSSQADLLSRLAYRSD